MLRSKIGTGKDGGKYKVIYDDGKPSFIHQEIVAIGKDMLKVKSGKGKEYWVAMSDKVFMTMNPNIKDIAIVGTFKDGWLVTDVIPYVEPVKEEPDDEELQRQLDEFYSLGGGY